MNISKAVEEVWKWREAVHQQTKGMTLDEQIAYFRGACKRLEEKTGRKLNLPRREQRPKSP